MQLLDNLKLLTGNNPNFTDDILSFHLEGAKNTILNYCHLENVPVELEHVQIEIALKRLNRMGQEGSENYSEGGISQSFDDVLTKDIKSQLHAFRKVVF